VAGTIPCYDGSTSLSDLDQICHGAPVVKQRVRRGRSGGDLSADSTMFTWSALWVKLTLTGALLYLINVVKCWFKQRSKPNWSSNLHNGNHAHGIRDSRIRIDGLLWTVLKGALGWCTSRLSGKSLGDASSQSPSRQKLAGKPYRPGAHPR
jgi:hypothetical protein